MQVAVVTFGGFNEIHSFAAAHIVNRLRPKIRKAFITSPGNVVTSIERRARARVTYIFLHGEVRHADR